MLKILLTGVSGQVGSCLRDVLTPVAEIYAPARSEMDLLSADSLRAAVQRSRPNWILHAAAYTAVDRAESEPDICYAVNTEATRVLADEARAIDATLVTFSSDYVFDGSAPRPYREDDAPGPINVYGRSKLLAEEALNASGSRFFNFRTSWVYSDRGNNFVKTMLRLGASRTELNVVADQHGCPSAAADIASAVANLLQRSKSELATTSGHYHLAGTGETTWYGFAAFVLATARALQPELTWAHPAPVSSAAYATAARRPTNSRLDCSKAAEVLGLQLPAWTDSAKQVVAALVRAS